MKTEASKPFPVQVMTIGPGSQADDDGLEYLPMPQDMAIFRAPLPPDAVDPAALRHVCTLLAQLVEDMRRTPFGSAGYPRIELTGLAPEVIDLLNQTLGQGEVSAMVRTSRAVRLQESAFAGVWRVQELRDDGGIASDRIEACAMPEVLRASVATGGAGLVDLPPAPTGVMNSPALLTELLDQSGRYKAGRSAHVINLTLLPVTPQDLNYLGVALGGGAATILSRGYGNCRIGSTALTHVWWVQYFNSMDQLILNTLEVVDVPEVALAAREDYEDSIVRLAEWLVTLEAEAEAAEDEARCADADVMKGA
jgi:hydrogenase-1 operon protein HyaF